MRSHTPTDFVLLSNATVQMTFRKVLLSCIMRMLVFPLQVTPLTQPVSSIRLQVHTRKNVSSRVRNTSLLLPAVVQDVLSSPDNMAAGPASYGMTDTMGRMHSDAQFAGSSSVPAHVEMMGLIGMGNNPMVGATVAVAVSVEEAAKAGKF